MSDSHVIERARRIVDAEGPMTASEIAGRLAETGAALAVISPESVEEYERDDETVHIVRGGSHMAISADALEKRMRRQMSGLRKKADGTWRTVDVATEEIGGQV